jgi:hypothetical protein
MLFAHPDLSILQYVFIEIAVYESTTIDLGNDITFLLQVLVGDVLISVDGQPLNETKVDFARVVQLLTGPAVSACESLLGKRLHAFC